MTTTLEAKKTKTSTRSRSTVPVVNAFKGKADYKRSHPATSRKLARGNVLEVLAKRLASASPMEMVDVERKGVDARILSALSDQLHLSKLRVFSIVGGPKATMEKKIKTGAVLDGTAGQASIGLARLYARAQELAQNVQAPADFDSAEWLGRWIEIPQPALGGQKPAELISSPTGLGLVLRLLGAMESGAYQ